MRRLACILFTFSAGIFAANCISAPRQLLYVSVMAAAVAVCLLFLKGKLIRLIAFSFLAFAVSMAWFSFNSYITCGRVSAYENETIGFEAELADYPIVYEGYTRADIRAVSGELKGLKGILYDSSDVLDFSKPGQRFYITAKIRSSTVRYGEDYDYYISKGLYYTANSQASPELGEQTGRLCYLPLKLNRRLVEKIDGLFSADTEAFIKSLMLGDKTDLYDDTHLYNILTRAGLMHIVAVSGLHVAFVIGLIRLLFGNGRLSSLTAILTVWTFVVVTGATPSAARAGVMQTVLVMAPVFGREDDGLTSLSLALFLILAANPFSAASVSLQLSFAAMAGLILFSEKIYTALCRAEGKTLKAKLGRYLAGVCSGTVSVMIFTMPLTALHFKTVQILSVFSNILVLPLVSVCFCGAYISCFLSLIWPAAGICTAKAVSMISGIIVRVAGIISDMPFAAVYFDMPIMNFWLVLTYAYIIIAVFTNTSTGNRIIMATSFSLLTLAIAQFFSALPYRLGEGCVSVLDVGQGQCVVFMSGDDTAIVDCGNISNLDSAGEICGKYLLSRGRRKADCLVITHLHKDHASGAELLLEQIDVKTVVIPENAADSDGLLTEILESAERSGTEVIFLGSDMTLSCGDISLDLFAPTEAGTVNERAITGISSMGEFDVLFTADVSKAAEKALLKEHDISGIELYIVGHHGSKYSSSDKLLKQIGADTAIISVGYNTYGHPTDETLERLDAYGYNVYRTDLDGTVEIFVGYQTVRK